MASLGLGYYGSWLNVVSTITTNQQNLNLWTHINNIASSNYGWNRNGGKKLRGIITINSGVNIYSENPLIPAITIPADSLTTFRSYDQVIIINNGNILGASGIIGSGGNSIAGTDGGKGGTAIYTRRNIIISNNGNIYGGGGGGGGGGGAFKTWVTVTPTNCSGAQYCGQCCILNCQGRNYCSTPNDCTVGAACNSYCEYYTNPNTNCNGSTVGTCNTKSRNCITYTGGNGGRGQGYNKNFGLGISGVLYEAGIYTGDGGDGGNWGQDGQNGVSGSTTSFGNGGEGGCWIDGSELLSLQNSNDERGYSCTSTGTQTQTMLWSGWSSAPSITTNPTNGSGVTLSIEGTDLQIEPRQSLISILVNTPTNLGGQINLTNCLLLETLTCNTQNITTLNLTQCTKLKTINFNSNNLSTLNLTSCVSLQNLYVDNNNLSGNLSGLSNIYTPNDETRVISIKNNNMSATNINNIFNELPIKSPALTSEWSIYVNDNTGTCSCNWITAKNKNWRVYPNLYTLTKSINASTVEFMLDTSLLGDGNIPYTITGVTTGDINGASLTGNFALYKGYGLLTLDVTTGTAGTKTMTITINGAICSTTQSVTIVTTSSTNCNYVSSCTCCDTNPLDGCPPAFPGDPCYDSNQCTWSCGSCPGGTQYCIGRNVTTISRTIT
jgi:hypothetical protein